MNEIWPTLRLSYFYHFEILLLGNSLLVWLGTFHRGWQQVTRIAARNATVHFLLFLGGL
jgi:hypothetical protein